MIYFIWDSGTNAIKIGLTRREVGTRAAELQTGNPNALFLLGAVEGDERAEAVLHARFSSLRLAGEWFRVSQELVHFIRKAIDKEVEVVTGQGTERGICAVEWLEARFRERREWLAAEIRGVATRDGISKNALFSREANELPIRKRPRINGQGNKEWVWMAEEGWPKPIGVAS